MDFDRISSLEEDGSTSSTDVFKTSKEHKDIDLSLIDNSGSRKNNNYTEDMVLKDR